MHQISWNWMEIFLLPEKCEMCCIGDQIAQRVNE